MFGPEVSVVQPTVAADSGAANNMEKARASRSRRHSVEVFTLVYAVFIAGLCSIVYELLIATTASYFLGETVRVFSLTIGLYMAAMGLGAFVSKYVERNLLTWFVAAEVALGFLGAASIPMLYFSFTHTDFFIAAWIAFTVMIGLLIGFEIPFLTRILQDYQSLRVNIAHVLSLDYLGALIATVAFPLLLLPFLGTFKSGLVLGLINMSIGLLILWCFGGRIGRAAAAFRAVSVLVCVAIVGTLVASETLLAKWNEAGYDSSILFSERTRHQSIVLTRDRHDVRLYLDGHLQFSSVDEHRYHETLVHVPLAFAPDARSVLVLGGGDGMAVRELLKHPMIEAVTLVDLDAAVLNLAATNPHLTALNQDSLTSDPRVRVVAADAFAYLSKRASLYDVIIADLPDPNSTELARLYSREFYQLIDRNLAPDGVFLTQATSPFFALRAFWGIQATIGSVFPHTRPLHALVPSFGDWGFVLASRRPLDEQKARLRPGIATRFLGDRVFSKLFVFEKDLAAPSVQASTLDRPIVLSYYLEGWRYWPR